MSTSNCCFLTCIQVSQEAGQVVWYSHLFQNFPQFIVIHTVKGFAIINKAKIDVFLELSCFFDDPADVSNLISGPLPFLKPTWTSGSSQFTYCWSLARRILSMWDECNCVVVWAFFGIAFLRDSNESWPFSDLWPLLSFPNLLAYWVQHFNSIIFSIWNSSAENPSPPLALFILMLPKAYLTLESRMPGSRWVITPSWLWAKWL